MRTLLKVTVPVEAGNRAIKDGSLPKLVERTIQEYKVEQAYFLAQNGERSMMMFFDLKDPSLIPVIAEPFFMTLNAKVEFTPVMNAEDLKAGLDRVSKKQ